MKLDVLVFGAHPDDAELGCGGTISALVDEGKKVGMVDLTEGEMGTRGTRETRKQEAADAAEILGLSYRHNLNLGDSLFQNTRENQLKIIEQIRLTQPHICIIGANFDRHPDHGRGNKLCSDSIFYSGLQKIESSYNGEQQEKWRPRHVLYYMQDRPIDFDFVFDITPYWEIKEKAMLAYKTQLNVTDPGDEPETYISSGKFFKGLEARARYMGHLAGFEMGEPFKYANGPLGFNSSTAFFETNPAR